MSLPSILFSILDAGSRHSTLLFIWSICHRAIVPIGLCYAGTLWVGNAAYLYLSVSFIQMLKALMPVTVYSVGCVFGTEKFTWGSFWNLVLVTIGVAIASFGELNFNIVGVMYQMSSLVSESIRLVLVQILLQSRGLKLNPITTLYYVAPCCFIFLLVPFFALEFAQISNDTNVIISPLHMVANATAAFGLNMAVFLLIGKTSALTMNIGGVVKDWLLIALSVVMFKYVFGHAKCSFYLKLFTIIHVLILPFNAFNDITAGRLCLSLI